MTVCYVVMACVGLYDDYQTYPAVVFQSKEKAEQWVEQMTKHQRVYCPELGEEWEKEYNRLYSEIVGEGEEIKEADECELQEKMSLFGQKLLKDNPNKTWDEWDEEVCYVITETPYEGGY